MKLETDEQSGLWPLLEALCERELTPAEAARLEEFVRRDPQARKLYLAYLDLHGTLFWDAGLAAAAGTEERLAALVERAIPQAARHPAEEVETDIEAATPVRNHKTRLRQIIAATSAAAMLVAGLLILTPIRQTLFGTSESNPVAVVPPANTPSITPPVPAPTPAAPSERRFAAAVSLPNPNDVAPVTPQPEPPPAPTVAANPPTPRSTANQATVVAYLDSQVRSGWTAAGIEPSQRADDAEWLRRVYLDLAGHIPPIDVLEPFLADRNPEKRRLMVELLLDDPDYARNLSILWTRLLIGQSPPADVDRDQLEAFLREAFSRNRPWNEIVTELLTAVGPSNQNGAVNFLLAHLNDDAIPATAVTSRVFLGRQLQCTQCHNHPTHDWKQDEFWELNSFFVQSARMRQQEFDPTTGRMATVAVELAMADKGGPTYYETRNGLMRVAFPQFAGQKVDPSPETNRLRELSRIITTGDRPPISEALVNRMWGHFFGAGFTRQVDDMGPHSPPSHPEALARLADEFTASGFDIKQLVRWITSTEAYHLTSRFNDTNLADDPLEAEVPLLFSRMYVKPLTAEQLYDSLLVAGGAGPNAGTPEAATVRKEWLAQFIFSFQTEENDEATTFDGTIPQSLLLMNGDVVRQALQLNPGSWLHRLLSSKQSEAEKIEQLYLSALSRPPSSQETAAVRKFLRQATSRGPERHAQAYQDLFWACLNSNEFILNH